MSNETRKNKRREEREARRESDQWQPEMSAEVEMSAEGKKAWAQLMERLREAAEQRDDEAEHERALNNLFPRRGRRRRRKTP